MKREVFVFGSLEDERRRASTGNWRWCGVEKADVDEPAANGLESEFNELQRELLHRRLVVQVLQKRPHD